jgi:hypothetical protein
MVGQLTPFNPPNNGDRLDYVPDRSNKGNRMVFPNAPEAPFAITNGTTYKYQIDFFTTGLGVLSRPYGTHSFAGQIQTVIMLAVQPATNGENQSILSAAITGDQASSYYYKSPSSGGFMQVEQVPASNGSGVAILFSDVASTTGLQSVAWVCDPFNPSRFYRDGVQVASSAGNSVLVYRFATTAYIARDWYDGVIYGTWTGQLISLAIFSQPLSDTAVKNCVRQMQRDAI